jgi:hypothetical protein
VSASRAWAEREETNKRRANRLSPAAAAIPKIGHVMNLQLVEELLARLDVKVQAGVWSSVTDVAKFPEAQACGGLLIASGVPIG